MRRKIEIEIGKGEGIEKGKNKRGHFKFENEDEQRHIDDNKFVVPKHESETRILLLLQFFAGSLICLTISLIWIILSKIDGSITANPTTAFIRTMPVENLCLIYDTGLALDISKVSVFLLFNEKIQNTKF